jgi:hypothetical protein
MKLAHFYWPLAQTVLKNASRNRLPTVCIVCVSVLVAPAGLQVQGCLGAGVPPGVQDLRQGRCRDSSRQRPRPRRYLPLR